MLTSARAPSYRVLLNFALAIALSGQLAAGRVFFRDGCDTIQHCESSGRLCRRMQLRGGKGEPGVYKQAVSCRSRSDVAEMLQDLRGQSDVRSGDFIALLRACVRLSEEGEAEGSHR